MCDRVAGLFPSLSPRTLLALGTVFSVAGCGGDDGPTQPDPDPQPTTGTVEVTATTTGDTLDIDGYVVTLDGGVSETLDVNATVEFTDVDEGAYEIVVSDIQANCAPEGDRTRMVDVTAGDTTTMALSVACRAALFDRMVFTSTRDVGATELYVMRTDGSELQRRTDNVVHDIDGVWSPDGSTLAFTTERDANDEIYIMSPDGTNPINLTQDAGRDQRPTWTPAR